MKHPSNPRAKKVANFTVDLAPCEVRHYMVVNFDDTIMFFHNRSGVLVTILFSDESLQQAFRSAWYRVTRAIREFQSGTICLIIDGVRYWLVYGASGFHVEAGAGKNRTIVRFLHIRPITPFHIKHSIEKDIEYIKSCHALRMTDDQKSRWKR